MKRPHGNVPADCPSNNSANGQHEQAAVRVNEPSAETKPQRENGSPKISMCQSPKPVNILHFKAKELHMELGLWTLRGREKAAWVTQVCPPPHLITHACASKDSFPRGGGTNTERLAETCSGGRGRSD